MKATGIIVAALAALCAGSTTASASEIRTREVPNTPVLSGNGALWLASRSGGGIALRRAQPGADPMTVQALAPHTPFKGHFVIGDLAASDAQVLLAAYGFDTLGTDRGSRPAYVDWLRGPPGGPLEQIDTCPGEEFPRLRSVDVSGSAYAYRRCDDHLGHVEIRDEGSPPLSPAGSVGNGGFGTRIAGRYVAWLDGQYSGLSTHNLTDIVVYDRVAGEEVYRVPRAQIPGTVSSLDLQDDGKVAFVYGLKAAHSRPRAVGWASAAEPKVHRLPLDGGRLYDVRIGGDTIAYEAGRQFNGSIANAQIGTIDLEGHTKVLVRGADDFEGSDSFDFDGRRLLWRQLGCTRWRLVIRDVSAGPMASKSLRCRLRVLGHPVVKRGVATLRLGCAPLARPCYFAVALRLRGGRLIGSDEGRAPLHIRLTAYARRKLAREGSLRVTAHATIVDGASRELHRRATFRLRG